MGKYFYLTITPSERDIRVMIFFFCNITYFINKALTLNKIFREFFDKKTLIFVAFTSQPSTFLRNLCILICRKEVFLLHMVYIFSRVDQSSFWSGQRGSNPRPSRWQRDALPLSYARQLSDYSTPFP